MKTTICNNMHILAALFKLLNLLILFISFLLFINYSNIGNTFQKTGNYSLLVMLFTSNYFELKLIDVEQIISIAVVEYLLDSLNARKLFHSETLTVLTTEVLRWYHLLKLISCLFFPVRTHELVSTLELVSILI